MNNKSLIITTINVPTESIKSIVKLIEDSWDVVIVADKKTPLPWQLKGTTFLSLEIQQESKFSYAKICPFNSYARKNIGYLYAMANGARCIAETDDDNRPYSGFLQDLSPFVTARLLAVDGWVNVYRLFTDSKIWPRGFPLEEISTSFSTELTVDEPMRHRCAIQQFLADGDPDVDAIYRLLNKDPVLFKNGSFALRGRSYCPFNSQNTAWFPEAYPLMYLPGHVSFRMTDIWRSFIAQVCLSAVGGSVSFSGATVFQERNAHDLMKDFQDEIPGYVHNSEVIRVLEGLRLGSQSSDTIHNLRKCYEALVACHIVPAAELELLESWIADLGLIPKREGSLTST